MVYFIFSSVTIDPMYIVCIAVTVDIECMAEGCNVILPEDMVLDLITKSQIREKYQRFAFQDYVNVSMQIPCLSPLLFRCPYATVLYAESLLPVKNQ